MVLTVSITDIDNRVSPEDLSIISQKYPFVEWGINIGSSQNCASTEWLNELLVHAEKIRLRGILHNPWKSDMLGGKLSLKIENPKLWQSLHRIQINIDSGYENIVEAIQLIRDKEIVIETNFQHKAIIGSQLNTYLLLPQSQLFTFPGYCGYSIQDNEISLVMRKHSEPFWIDVKVSDSNIDLLKIEEILDWAEEYVTSDSWIRALLQTDSVKKRLSENP